MTITRVVKKKRMEPFIPLRDNIEWFHVHPRRYRDPTFKGGENS